MKLVQTNDLIHTNHIAEVKINGAAAEAMTPEQWSALLDRFGSYIKTGLVKVTVWLGTGGLPDTYIYVVWTFDKGNPLHMGIDPEGRAST